MLKQPPPPPPEAGGLKIAAGWLGRYTPGGAGWAGMGCEGKCHGMKKSFNTGGLDPILVHTGSRLLFTDPGGVPLRHFWVPACLPTHPLPPPGGGVGILAQNRKSCAWAPKHPQGLTFR